jgi:adenylate cyclase class 2
MLEIEMKFPVTDLAAVGARLIEASAGQTDARQEVDQYFNAPDRDFARTDEALRLRHIGPVNLVTYKGPKLDPQTKTRREVEVRLADGPDAANAFAQLLSRLGYRSVTMVSKRRRVFHIERQGFSVEICLDEVEGLGPFVELEIMAPEDNLNEARTLLLQLAAELGLSHSERRSYLELLLEARERKPV